MMIQSQMCSLGRIGRDGWLTGTGISLRRKSLPAFSVGCSVNRFEGCAFPFMCLKWCLLCNWETNPTSLKTRLLWCITDGKIFKEILIFSCMKNSYESETSKPLCYPGGTVVLTSSWPLAGVKALIGGELENFGYGLELSVFAQCLIGERKAGKPLRRCLVSGPWLFWRKGIWGFSLGPLCAFKIVILYFWSTNEK